MAKYTGIFSCGHEGVVGIIGPQKDRERKKEKAFSKMCPECYAKFLKEERKKANKEAEEKSRVWELPELTGTEKQVAWANTLRIQFIEKIKDKLNHINEVGLDRYDREELRGKDISIKKFKLFIQDVDSIVDYVLENKTEAKFFVENRSFNLPIIISIFKEIESFKEKEETKDIIDEATVVPKEIKYPGIVEIKYTNTEITTIYEKNEDFRVLVKTLGFSWNNGWIRTIKERNGSIEDRVVELGSKLLNAGFCILILDENVRNKAINADYEVECKRWILLREKTKKLAINWTYGSDLYNVARKLPGSKWSSPSVVVDVSHFKELEEFAKLYDFKFTAAARNYIEKYKEEIKNLSTVEIVNSKEYIQKDGLSDILNSSRDILDDLKEDD